MPIKIHQNIANNFPSFGTPLYNRGFSFLGGYKYGFNGKERDPETFKTGGNSYDYGFRIYNPSIGRFLSVDPLKIKFPWLTPYQFASNRPIIAVDKDGKEATDIDKNLIINAAVEPNVTEPLEKGNQAAKEMIRILNS